jgi:ISXO2-like transposase domain
VFERVLLSPWINGTHHGRIEPRHLQAYLNEFVFRFNRRFYPMNSRYYGADATRISRRPAPAFGAWLSLTLYPHFATSALKSAATFMTSKNRSRVSGQISQTWMPRSSCFRLAQILMPFRPNELIAVPGTLLTMSYPGLRKTLCGPHQGRSRRLK